MDVSENKGTPKSSILIGFSFLNHPFWGTPIFGNIHIKPFGRIAATLHMLNLLAGFQLRRIGSNVNFEICTPSLKLTALAAPKNGWMVGRRLFPFGASKGLFFMGEIEGIYHIPLWQDRCCQIPIARMGIFPSPMRSKNTPG